MTSVRTTQRSCGRSWAQLLLLLLLITSTAAFVSHPTTMSPRRTTPTRLVVGGGESRSMHPSDSHFARLDSVHYHRRHARSLLHQHGATKRKSQTKVEKNKSTTNTNTKTGTTPPPRTRINDGSPIGVAVVALGFIWTYFFTDDFNDKLDVGESPTALLIFATASIAAGLERLFLRKPKQE